jgi:hypothetical protein
MNETQIIKQLNKHFANHDYRLQNVFIYSWESDFFCMSSSGYTIEVEVKISKSDFKADFKKRLKHKYLASATKGLVAVNMGSMQNLSMVEFKIPNTPNKFYYCCPEGLISKDDIPEYAGLLYLKDEKVNENYYSSIVEIKPAKFLHKNKPDISKTLLDKYYWLYQNLKNDFIRLQMRVREIEDEVNWSHQNFNNNKIEISQTHYEPKLFSD